MIRFVLAVMIFSLMVTIGKIRCTRMKKRVRTLREIELFLKLMKPRTEYLHEEITKTVSVLSENNRLSELEFLKECVSFCEKGTDFPLAWTKSVAHVPLKKSETELLSSFGKAVSSANSSDISGIMSFYETSFEAYAKEAVNTFRGDSRTCMSVFSAIGILFGIIIV